MTLRSMLRPVLGREHTIWRTLPWPRLRRRVFGGDVDCVIFGLLVSLRHVFFIQVGSNDGRTGDPLWTFRRYPHWRGILVEPVNYVFQRLVTNYSPWRHRFIFENAAIAREGGTRTFHYFDQSDTLTAGYDQLGSLDGQLLQRRARALPGANIVSASVNCLTFSQLCEKHHVSRLDLLHIDAEGADGEILEQVDFTKYRPGVLFYEHKHLSTADQQHTNQRLGRAGYECVRIGIDTLAVRRASLTAFPVLAAAWRLTSRSGARCR